MSGLDVSRAVDQLSALSQETRLNVLRILIKSGADGVPATELAERLGVRQNLMSSHLSTLVRSGLTRTRRDGRRVYHSVDLDATSALLRYLNQELDAEAASESVSNASPEAIKRRTA